MESTAAKGEAPTSARPVVELRRVSKVYGRGDTAVVALGGIDLRIDDGEFVAIMGPSGSGKSTCMNILGCLDTPTGGSYRFRGVEVTALNRNQRALLRRHYLGFVFQGYNLLNRTTALENVEVPLVYRHSARSDRDRRAIAALERVGLADRADHFPTQLSGGQQQRVAIARALVTEPTLILADEPTGNLDSRTSLEIMALFQKLNREQGLTIVLVTHEPDIAAFMSRALVFKDGMLISDRAIPSPQDAAQALEQLPTEAVDALEA